MNVTNTGSVGRAGCVLITPYNPVAPFTSSFVSGATPSIQQQPLIKKLLIKAVSDSTKKEAKTFTLRNVNPIITKTCERLKDLIREQLMDDIIPYDFDVGYIEGNTVVSLRTTQDILEVWSSINQGKKVMMWCDGLKEDVTQKSTRKRKNRSEDDISGFNAKKSKEEKDKRVDKVISSLKEAHATNYTNMQYRIWAEMIIGGIYSSYDSPPNSSMFMRAGGGSTTPKSKSPDMNQSLSDIAKCLNNVLSPPHSSGMSSSGTSSSGTSPAKSIDSRSKCYKQLGELNDLRIAGVLDEEEYLIEKKAVMTILKKV